MILNAAHGIIAICTAFMHVAELCSVWMPVLKQGTACGSELAAAEAKPAVAEAWLRVGPHFECAKYPTATNYSDDRTLWMAPYSQNMTQYSR
jgi:hypothetical protein